MTCKSYDLHITQTFGHSILRARSHIIYHKRKAFKPVRKQKKNYFIVGEYDYAINGFVNCFPPNNIVRRVKTKQDMKNQSNNAGRRGKRVDVRRKKSILNCTNLSLGFPGRGSFHFCAAAYKLSWIYYTPKRRAGLSTEKRISKI